MRILLDYRPALRQRTGVGEYVHELARALVATTPGPDEALVLFSASWKDRLDPKVIPGAEVVDRRIPVRWLNLMWHRLGWPQVERLAGPGLDVVQSMHPLMIPSRKAARIVTVHDLDFLDHPERTRAEIRRDYPVLASAHARAADRVVVNSRDTAQQVEARLGVPAEQISVVHPGAPAWIPREREPASGYLLFLGTLEPRKNLAALLDAYEQVLATAPDVPPLKIAGQAGREAAALVARVTRPPLAGRVSLAGYIQPAHREDLYRGALALVIPSHTEGFGIPALEAMTAGVPVIATRRGALPEVIGDAGILTEPDAESLARSLTEVLASPGRRQAMREAGLIQSRKFQWRQSAQVLRTAWALAVETRRSARG